MVLQLNIDVDVGETEKLRARARKAELPLAAYVLAAALSPIKYVWAEDIPRRVWEDLWSELPEDLVRPDKPLSELQAAAAAAAAKSKAEAEADSGQHGSSAFLNLQLSIDTDAGEGEVLRVRARRAELPLAAYVLAAALNPYNFVWIEDLSKRVWEDLWSELPEDLVRPDKLPSEPTADDAETNSIADVEADARKGGASAQATTDGEPVGT